jgi:hypothetical protein
VPSVSAITHDLTGNLILAGQFSGQTSFNTASGQTALTATGTQDVYLAKYDTTWNLAWSESLQGSGTSTATASAIAVDSNGYVFVTGSFTGTVDFDPGAGKTTLTSKGSSDIFTAKYAPTGALVWARQAGGSSGDAGLGIAVDAAGDVYTTGSLRGQGYFNPGSQSATISSVGSTDVFVWKLTSAGDFVWAKDMGGSKSDVGKSLALDTSGNVYVAGSFEATADFDPGAGVANATSVGGKDAFIVKLDGSGNFQWVKTFGGSSDDAATAVATDSLGNVYATGTFQGSFDVVSGQAGSALTSRGNTDVFLTKFDTSGSFLWARGFGGSAADSASALALDGSGNAYVTGSFQQTAKFSVGPSTLASNGSGDAFVLKFDPSGTPLWAQNGGGTGSDSAVGVASDSAGNPEVAGSFSGAAQFGAPAAFALTSGGPTSDFLWSLKSDGTSTNAETLQGTGGSTAGGTGGTGTGTGGTGIGGTGTGGTGTGGTGTGGTGNGTGTGSLNPTLPPSGNFNLTNWNLTLPTGTAGHPDVISTTKLDSGYTSQYFSTGPDGAMTFWCPVTGVTTSGSSYPRSELRETKSDGTLYNWNVLDGTATLSATLAVNQLPSTGKIVVGQIHDNGAGGVKDEPLLKLIYEYNSASGTGTIVAQVRATPTSSNTDYTLATGIKLNTQFSYQIQLRSDLTLVVQINGVTQYSRPIDTSWEAQGLYFKAGAYVQDNVGPVTEGGMVSFYALTVSHSSATSASVAVPSATAASQTPASSTSTSVAPASKTSTSSSSSAAPSSSTSSGSTSTLNPSLAPSGNFNLSGWNLTLPTGTAGHPNVVSTSTLDSGYSSSYFYTGSTGAMTFWSPVNGVTTSGTTYPRTELRETKPDGSLYNWNVLAGTATLNATLAINQVPSTGKIVIGQIHDDGAGGISDQPLIKLVFEYDSTTNTGKIVAQVRSTPTGSNTDYTLATGIKLNQLFSYQIQLRPDLTLSVQINGVTKYNKPISSSWESQGLYFKAGAYVQDNVGTSTEGGRVSFYALAATHA